MTGGRPMTTVVHVRDPSGFDVYIGRAVPRRGFKESKWANPYPLAMGTREEVIAAYERYLDEHPELIADLHELRGLRLGCWCKDIHGRKDVPCHGDVLVRRANALP